MCSLAPVSSAIVISRAIWSLALGRPAQKAQTGGDGALVDLAVAHQVVVLAVAHEGLAEHLAVVHGATHHAGALDATAVVREGDGAVLDHVAHLGDDLALEALGHGAGGYTRQWPLAAATDLMYSMTTPLSVTGSVLGIEQTPVKPPLAAAAVSDSMSPFGLKARLAKVHMHIDEAGD